MIRLKIKSFKCVSGSVIFFIILVMSFFSYSRAVEKISLSSDVKESINNSFKLTIPENDKFKKLESSHTIQGMPDSLYMVDPINADNPVTESFMSKMQQISRFRRSGESSDETNVQEPFRSYVYKVRGARIYLDKGNDSLRVNQKFSIFEGSTGRPLGVVVIKETNKTGSVAAMIEGHSSTVKEGCYIDF
jgi:hypothetical protein